MKRKSYAKNTACSTLLRSFRLRCVVAAVVYYQNLTLHHVMCQLIAEHELNQLHTNQLKRKLIYIPPPPVTPFRGGLKSVQHNHANGTRSDQSQSSEYASAWTPEQYPDPFSNPLACGGAATALFRVVDGQIQPRLNSTNVQHLPDQDLMHWFDIPSPGYDEQPVSQAEQTRFQSQKKLLFCDPDQLLDVATLKDVAVKLQSFARTFASATPTFAEGGNFGSNEETTSIGSSEDGNVKSDNDQMAGNVFANLISSIVHGSSSNEGTPDDGVQKRKLRGIRQFTFAKDIDRELGTWEGGTNNEPIEVGIALVKKIDLPAILRADSYFFYSDQDDMMNDAAQYFARYIHDTWSRHLMMQEQRISPTNIVLIFISTSDKVCYISSGTRIATILPWWRLEHVVQDMKPDLRKGQIGAALSIGIDDLTKLLQQGPPSFLDRLDDFVERFGVVIAFTLFTFVFATWGECRDRRNRFFSAERMSRMSKSEKEKARRLQMQFKTKACPICLEPFETNKQLDDEKPSATEQKKTLKRVDSFGVPLIGTDNKPIKMLRCGHIFDSTCWKIWVDSGQGNPWVCPVCRQDVGRVKRRRPDENTRNNPTGTAAGLRDVDTRQHEVEDMPRLSFARVPTPSMLLLPVGHTHPAYSSVQSLASFGGTPFAPFSHPPLRRLYPRPQMTQIDEEMPTEETPLFAQAQSAFAADESDDY